MELEKQIKSGSIHTSENFFLDVYKVSEKAVQINWMGKKHWAPKSVFQEKDLGNGLVVFGVKQWFINKLENQL